MRQTMLMAILACVTGLALATEPPSAPTAAHPLVGNWSWTLPGTRCTETLDYRADGSLNGTSGNAAVQVRYEVATLPGLQGFYRMVETVTASNSNRDCSGDLQTVTGEATLRFAQFSPDFMRIIFCREPSLKACYGPLQRRPGHSSPSK